MHLLVCFFLINSGAVRRAIELAQDSGRVLLIGESDAERMGSVATVPPGLPPVLSFRYMEGSRRHRFGDLDLVLDDAGH